MSQWPARLTVDPERVAALRRAAGATKPHAAAPLLYSRMAAHVAPETTPQAMGVPPDSLRHAGHEWELRTPLQVGRAYEFSDWALISDETKPSRSGGSLRFAVFARSWADDDGHPVQTERMTAVCPEVLAPSDGRPPPRPGRPTVPARRPASYSTGSGTARIPATSSPRSTPAGSTVPPSPPSAC